MGGLVNSVKNVVLGKNDPGQAAQTVDMRTDQEKALQNQLTGKFGELANRDTSGLANAQIAAQENAARQSAEDQRMKAAQMVAQRGLGGTSIGLSALNAPTANLASQLGTIRAGRTLLEDQLKTQGLNQAAQGLSGMMAARSGSQIYQPAVASQGRQGGLAPLLGGAIGAKLGGAEGAKIGMGLGQAATKIG